MAIYRRFKVQQKYVNGQPTEEYRLGVEIDSTDYNSLEECNRGSDCTQLEYRWVDMESADDYICDGTNKYKKQMKQQKCVTEEAWTNVYPYEYQKGDLIEHDSVDCGYVSGGYHIYGATDGHGSINISPSKEYYSSADVVTITALPSTNYMFSCYNYGGNMTYGSVAYNSVLSLTMSHNWYVSAVFKSASPSVGSLYYSYYNGQEIWYEWSKSTLSKSDNAGSLASIIIDYSGVIQTIPSSAFSSHSYLISISLPNCSYIGDAAFYSCHKLQSVSLPLCEYIDSYAFDYCWALQLIDLSVCLSINRDTFHDCLSLVSVNLPNCTFIGDEAFRNCPALLSISLPLCEYLGDDALWGCEALQSIDLPKCSEVGGLALYYCTSLVSVSLPLCISIGSYAFQFCSSLSSIDLPLCTYVSNGTFNDCSNLRIVHLPKVKSFRGTVFTGTPIETLYMDQITSVPSGGDPFGKSFSYLKSIIIPCFLVDDFLSHSIWSKYSSYYVCTDDDTKKIITATDGGGIITLDPEGGRYYSGTTVNIGYSANPGYVFSYFQYGSTRAYGSTVLNESFSLIMNQNWYVSVNFDYGATSSGRLYYRYYGCSESWYNWSKSTLSKADNNGSMAKIIIDYGGVVQTIPSSAFQSQSRLIKIVFPNCTYINASGFEKCWSLSYIELPNCSYVGYAGFGFCSSLSYIDLLNCSYIGDYGFTSCHNLSIIHLPKVTYIGSNAFSSAPIETLYMNQITSVPSGGDPSISRSYIKSIFIPCSLLDSFVSHSIWSKYSSYFVCV